MERSDWLRHIAPVIGAHPQLKVAEGAEKRLVGTIDIRADHTGERLESFELDILFPELFPSCFPLVWETGGKIPRIVDRHVMPIEGTLCLAPPPEVKLLCLQGLTAERFVERILLPRLAEEYIVRNGGKYQREYTHGMPALWEFYQRYLGIGFPTEILQVLQCMLDKQLPKDGHNCPCGSRLMFKDCHKPKIKTIEILGSDNWDNFYRLKKHWKEVNSKHINLTI